MFRVFRTIAVAYVKINRADNQKNFDFKDLKYFLSCLACKFLVIKFDILILVKHMYIRKQNFLVGQNRPLGF